MKITSAEKEYINNHSNEAYSITKNTRKTVNSYGNVTLDGEQALTHSRNRTVGNDFTRAGRQREVLEAIMSKMVGMGTSKLLELSDSFLKEIKTNMNVTNYIGQLTNIMMNSSEYMNNITSQQIPSTDYAKGEMISGVYYFVSDPNTMKQDMIDSIYKE